MYALHKKRKAETSKRISAFLFINSVFGFFSYSDSEEA